MRLGDPADPFGVALLRKVLLTFSLACIVIAAMKALRGDLDVAIFASLAAGAATFGLFVEPVLKVVTRGRR